MNTDMATMSKAERHELMQVIKKRERVMKMNAAERSATLLAEFEAHMSQVYHFDDDETWRKAEAAARQAVEAANDEIARRCLELGIPKEFAPHVAFGWASRGHNAVLERRTELLRTAKARIAAIEAEAVARIEKMALEAQTDLVQHGMDSAAAKKFLNDLPDIASLMPPVQIGEVQTLLEVKMQKRKQLGYDWNQMN